jgi:hypothetical protein
LARVPQGRGLRKGPDAAVNQGESYALRRELRKYGDLLRVATDRLLGRDTAGTGDVEELTVGGGVEFTGSGGIQRSALTGDVTATAGSGTTTIANNAVSDAKLRDSSALSVIGRSANSSGDPADIAASADEQVLARRGSVVGFYGITAFEAYRAAGTLTLATGATGTDITFDTEVDDTNGAGSTWFVHTTGIATAPRAGWYIFSGTATVPNVDDNERVRVSIYKNGAVWADSGTTYSPGADNTIAAHVTTIMKLAANDTVNLHLIHNEGANQTATVGVNFCRFTGAQLR